MLGEQGMRRYLGTSEKHVIDQRIELMARHRDGRYAHVEAERLKLISLFKRLDDNALRLLAQKFSSEYVDAGQIVYAQGTPGLKFYLIVRGMAQVSALSAKRNNTLLQLV